MNWIDRLERRFRRFGIPNLVNGLLLGQLAVGLLILLVNRNVWPLIQLTRAGLLRGQIWRLVTFLFDPIWFGGVLGILNLAFYFWIGNSLTRVWGDFRTTLYIALGMVGAWIGCLLTGYASPDAIFISLLFAYTWEWPNQQVLLFGIIPFKMKWLGWYELLVWAVSFLTGGLADKISLILGLAGFLAFYGREVFFWCKDAIAGAKRRHDWQNRNR